MKSDPQSSCRKKLLLVRVKDGLISAESDEVSSGVAMNENIEESGSFL
jgi:hypothetical protein